MNPKPLDLRYIDKWIKSDLLVKEGDIDRAITLTLQKVKERIKKACEFYLRYKDRPDLFDKEQKRYVKKMRNAVLGKGSHWIYYASIVAYPYEDENKYLLRDYNEWLLMFAFKDAFETDTVINMNPEPLKNKVWETRAMYKKNNQYSGEEIFTKEDVKSACEFYLRYKDRAKKFITDFPEYAENIVLIVDVYTDGKQMADYNEWLFKLAFKDVFGGD